MRKNILHFLAILCTVILGVLPAGADTVSPYKESFDGLDTSKRDFAPLGWSHIVDSYSDWYDEYFVEYTNEASGGQDGGAYLAVGSQMLGDYGNEVNDMLVTPPVTGNVGMYLKLSGSGGEVKLYSCTENDGKLEIGEELDVEGLDELSESAWSQVTLPAMPANSRIAIRLDNACIDEFTADAAEIIKKASLKIDNVTCVGETEPIADADGKFKVAFDVMLTNNGQVDLSPGYENYSISIIDSEKSVVFFTKDIDVDLAVNESTETPVRIEAEVDIAQYSGRDRYDVQENISGTSSYGAWIEPIPYVGILEVLNSLGQSIRDEAVFDYGIVKDTPVTKSFRLRNNGGKDLTITEIKAPDGYSFSLTTPITVAYGESKTIDITLGTESAGSKAGKIVFVNDGTVNPEIAVSGMVLSPDIFYEDFEDELSPDFIVATNWERTDYPDELSSDGNEYWMSNSNSTEMTMLITPKLVVGDGDSFSFRAAKRSAYNGYLNIYYSADRVNWIKVRSISYDGEEPDRFTDEQPSYSSYNYCFSSFSVSEIPAGEWYIAFEAGFVLLDDIAGYKLAPVDHDLYITKEALPVVGMVNNDYEAKLTVKNLSAEAEEPGSYTAKLYIDGEAVAESEPVDEAWITGEERTFSVSYTPHAAGDVTAYVQIEMGNYVLKSSEVVVNISNESANMEHKIGEAVSTDTNIPLALNWKKSQSQTVYTKDLLNMEDGSEIVNIAYDGYVQNDKDVTFHIKVWMANVEQETMGTDNIVDESVMTLVYEGDHKLEPQGSEDNIVRLLDLPLSVPFVYDGNNLCVMVESVSDDYKAVNFTKDTSVSNVSVYRRSDTDLPDEWSSVSGMPVVYMETSRDVPVFSGTVTGATTGAYISGATVELVSGNVIYQTETDDEGAFVMDVFQSDKTYTLTVKAEYYETYSEDGISLAEGNVDKNIYMETSRDVPVFSGTVTDATTGAYIGGATVELVSGNVIYQTETDDEGAFGMYVFQSDKTYTLTVEAECYETYSEDGMSLAEGSIVKMIMLTKIGAGVKSVQTDGFSFAGGHNSIIVNAPYSTTLAIYDVGGRLIRLVEVAEGRTVIRNLAKGIYVVHNSKVAVR